MCIGIRIYSPIFNNVLDDGWISFLSFLFPIITWCWTPFIFIHIYSYSGSTLTIVDMHISSRLVLLECISLILAITSVTTALPLDMSETTTSRDARVRVYISENSKSVSSNVRRANDRELSKRNKIHMPIPHPAPVLHPRPAVLLPPIRTNSIPQAHRPRPPRPPRRANSLPARPNIVYNVNIHHHNSVPAHHPNGTPPVPSNGRPEPPHASNEHNSNTAEHGEHPLEGPPATHVEGVANSPHPQSRGSNFKHGLANFVQNGGIGQTAELIGAVRPLVSKQGSKVGVIPSEPMGFGGEADMGEPAFRRRTLNDLD
ncbi:hypothetical protein C8Q75DRAFT_763131 [Abortiporus biennis]|nr:hypothetical protein C8Q75DRAFT_763131 [Abortiporus biennis]